MQQPRSSYIGRTNLYQMPSRNSWIKLHSGSLTSLEDKGELKRGELSRLRKEGTNCLYGIFKKR